MQLPQYVSNLHRWLSSSLPYTAVVGNSGADYDSVVGSLLLAYLLTSSIGTLHLPFIDCAREDVGLRFEVKEVLMHFGVGTDDLLYVGMLEQASNQPSKYILYDHNLRQSTPADNITLILDHHSVSAPPTAPSIIHRAGSTLSLLALLVNPQLPTRLTDPALHLQYTRYLVQPQLASASSLVHQSTVHHLLYYGILLDTYNMQQKYSNAWGEVDQLAVDWLQKRIIPEYSYESLLGMRYDQAKLKVLTLSEHLRRDYKQIHYPNVNLTVQFSTIGLNWPQFRAQHMREMEGITMGQAENGGNVVRLLLFSYPDGGQGQFSKYVLYSGAGPDFGGVMEGAAQRLGLRGLGAVGRWDLWQDRPGTLSRKDLDRVLKSM